MRIMENITSKHKEEAGLEAERQIRDSFIYLLPLLVSNLLPFLTLPIFTRILTKEDYGVLALSQVYAVFVGGIANFGMNLAYERNFFQYHENRKEAGSALFSSVLFVLFNTTVLGFLTYLYREPLSAYIIGSSGHGNILFWAFLNQCAMNLVIFYQLSLRNAGESIHYLSYTVATSLLNLLLSLYFVALARIGVIGLVYAPLIANGMIFSLLSRRYVKAWSFTLSWPLFLESLKISYPLTPRIFLGAASQQFDKYMIGIISTLGGVGIYRIGQQIASLAFSYMTQLENVFVPQTYRHMFDRQGGGREAVGRHLTPFFYVSIGVAFLVCLFSEEVITILTPPAFHEAIDIVTILSLYYGVLFFSKITGIQLIYMKKTHITSLLTLSSLALNVAINIPFIFKWGAIGAAWGTMLSGMLSCAVSFSVAQHYYGVRWEYRKIIPVLLLFFSAALVTLVLRGHVEYVQRLALKLLLAGTYVYLGIWIRVITAENIGHLRNLLRLRSRVPTQRSA
jgi:O-antigen/teichoic acid export membrane protein